MDDLISRQQAIKALIRLAGRETKNEIIDICAENEMDGLGWIGGILDSIGELEDLQSAQPKTGKWLKKMHITETEKYTFYDPDWYCACCGAKYDPHMARMVNFCYVCGADMRGEKQ